MKKITILIILGLLVTTLPLATAEENDIDTNVTEYGGPELDFEFIYRITKNLSDIIYEHPKSREFGTSGEQLASELLAEYMEEIGLSNVHMEKIGGDWTQEDSWQNIRNFFLDPDYRSDPWIEELDLKKNFTKWHLHIKIYDKDNILVDEKNFSEGTCFPFLKEEKKNEPHNVTIKDIRIFDDFKRSNPDGVVLIESNWPAAYDWWVDNSTNLLRDNVKGFIVMDSQDDTFFMMPSGTSSPILARFSKPGFSINGSSGKWIKQYLNDPDYVVKADFCSEWTWERVDSWNVIGDVPGKSSKIAMICAHHDSWWNQGTCDQLLSVTMAMGIAKYLIDNDITPELTLRIVAFAGEEWYYHGSKSYVKNHAIKKYGCANIQDSTGEPEDIIYAINPSNIGFNKTFDMSFNVGHPRDDSLMRYMHNIARELQYTERTGIGIIGEYSIWANDVAAFFHGHRYPERYCKHAIEFDRFPYPGYQRDSNNHTGGDSFNSINDTLFRVDAEVIAEIILRLINSKLKVEITRPLEKSLYLRNLHILSLPRNTFLLGPIDITADIATESEIEKVEFYIDGKLKKTITDEPFTYRWRSFKLLKHTIKVVAYDKEGYYAEDEVLVR